MKSRIGRRTGTALAVIDLAAAGVVGVHLVLTSLMYRLTGRRTPQHSSTLLSIEADYSLDTVRRRGLEHTITCRDLDGFFDHVWTVHPCVGADPADMAPGIGPPSTTPITDRHTMIEGTVGYSRWLRAMPALNFALAQSQLLRMLNRVVRTERIGMIRASEPYYLGLLGLLLARSNRVPLAIRLIANYDSIFASGRAVHSRLFRRRSIEKRIDRFVLSRADLVAAGNEDILGYALANGATEERSTILLVGSLIPQMHFEQGPEPTNPVAAELNLEGRPFLVCVTRLEEVKHPEDVVMTLAEARKRFPDLAAVLVGDGTKRSELEKMAAELGLQDDVVFAGNRDQEGVAQILRSASVVLSPITGRSLVEAALSGTVIVAYDFDWQSELVRPGQTGVLVRYRDTHEMAEAVCELMSDPGRAAALGRQARAFALEKMDPASLVAHERAEYAKLMRRDSR